MTEEFKQLHLSDSLTLTVGNLGTIIGPKGAYTPSNNNQKKYYRIHTTGGFYAVHRLVALAWVPNPDGKSQVNHKDGDKSNNRAENLEWVTNQENRVHAVKNNLSSAKLKAEQIPEIRRKYATGDYTYFDLADEYNVCFSTIGKIVNSATWQSVKDSDQNSEVL